MMTKKNKNSPFEMISFFDYIWKTPKKIESTDTKINACPYCNSRLREGFSLIPVENDKRAQVPGWVCGKCDILFINNMKPVRKLLINNLAAKDISLNGEYYWNYTRMAIEARRREKRYKRSQEKHALLNHIESSILLINAKSCDDKRSDINIVITNSNSHGIMDGTKIYHYSEPEALEVLTGAFVENRAKKFCFEGTQYSVCSVYKNKQNEFCHNYLMPPEIEIKSGGGYATRITNNFCEIVDLLIYSPFTCRLEIAHATFDRSTNECYMDISVYRKFVHDFGNPGLLPYFEGHCYSENCSDELREESILHAYGYNVSEGMSDAERHNLLAEIVDLELLSVSCIVHHLEFLMKLNKAKYNAQIHWENDKRFIENYNANPNRFLIASSRVLNDK